MSTRPVPYPMGNKVKIVVLGMQRYKRLVCLGDHFESVLCKFYKFLVILIIMAKNTRYQSKDIPSVAPLNDMLDRPVFQARCPRNLTNLFEL